MATNLASKLDRLEKKLVELGADTSQPLYVGCAGLYESPEAIPVLKTLEALPEEDRSRAIIVARIIQH
jgi:hypothetical protein